MKRERAAASCASPLDPAPRVKDTGREDRQIAVVKNVFRKIQKGQPMHEEEGIEVEAQTGKVSAAFSSKDEVKRCKLDRKQNSLDGKQAASSSPFEILKNKSGMVFQTLGGWTKQANGKKSAEQTQHTVFAPECSPRQILFSSVQDLQKFDLEPGDFRENICLEMFHNIEDLPTTAKTSNASTFHSLARSGLVLRVGKECLFRLTFHCEPCGFVLDLLPLARKTLNSGAGIPSIAQLVGFRGVLATCVTGGVVCPGDRVSVYVKDENHLQHSTSSSTVTKVQKTKSVSFDTFFEPFPNDVKGRVVSLLTTKVPYGRVTTIRDVLHYVGAPCGYARAIPAMLKSVVTENSSVVSSSNILKTSNIDGLYRLVDSQGVLMERHLPGHRKKLEAEGVLVDARSLKVADLPGKMWRPTHAELFLVEQKTKEEKKQTQSD